MRGDDHRVHLDERGPKPWSGWSTAATVVSFAVMLGVFASALYMVCSPLWGPPMRSVPPDDLGVIP